jgi:dTDP-4-dehydrorhamnose 3,5-epimerase
MQFQPTRFADSWLIVPRVFSDARGFFMESYSAQNFACQGISATFVQDNQSLSREKGVLRGLHFQKPPMSQAKLVRVLRGAIWDVIVDIRHNSPTCGLWQGFELSATNFAMLYVPRGFAHGFCTLEPDTEVLYKTDNFYSPEHDSGIIWNDSTLAIDWPVENPILSDKDRKLGELHASLGLF